MKIKYIKLKSINIPFKTSFKHASATRTQTETVIALVTSADGIVGYGEGCPRYYVTRETVATCLAFLELHQKNILSINSIESLKDFVVQNRSVIDDNPAAWCAIETALLDVLGKTEEKSIESLIRVPEITNHVFNYTAVLGVSNKAAFQAQLLKYIQFNMQDYKLKLSGDIDIDITNINAVLKTCPKARIRLDGNNIWQSTAEAQNYLKKLPGVFWALEEPITTGNYNGLLKIAESFKCQIILDESFLRHEQLTHIKAHPNVWILNIRISKLGGLLRSLEIAEYCHYHKIPFVVGAQVGETSLLTRMALSLVNTYPHLVLAQEGAFGTYLLEKDIVEPSLMFGQKGELRHVSHTSKNTNYGLGLQIDPQELL